MLDINTKSLVNAPPIPELEKLSALIEMFEEIDFNDDKKISFEEFINYLLSSAKGNKLGSKWFKNYKFKKVIQTSSSDESVKKICYFPKWDRIVTCGRTKKCKIINPSKDYKTEYVLPDHEGTILSAEYIEEHELLVTSSADLCVRFWGLNDQTNHYDMKYFKTCNRTGSQTVLRYSSQHKTLFTGSRTGHLNYWRYESVDDITYNKDSFKSNTSNRQFMFIADETKSDKIHDDVITDIIVLSQENKLITCSQDSLIKIFDLYQDEEGKYKVRVGTYKKLEGHKKGVFSIAWNSLHHFLISTGFEHEAFVWVSNIRATPFRLRDQKCPHQHSLVDVFSVEDSSQVITADIKGMIKVWDIRTFQCIQTLYTENASRSKHDLQGFNLSSITFLREPYNHIVTAGKKICIFEYEKMMKPQNADDQPIVWAAYNSNSLSFLTSSNKDIKIWDALTGKISRIFHNLHPSEITAVTLDDTGRKFFIGTHSGEVQAFTFSDGQFIKRFPLKRERLIAKSSYPIVSNDSKSSYNKEITSLSYCKDQRLLIATSWEGGVYLLGDRDASEGTLIKNLSGIENSSHKSDVRCSDFSPAYDLGITGDDSSKVIVWDLINFSKLWECVNPSKLKLGQMMRGSITSAKFLGTFPCFVCSDSTGFLHLWTVKPHHAPYRKVCSWRNYDISTKITPMVTCMEFHNENFYLYTGDERGNICVWDMEPIFEHAGIQSKGSKLSQLRKGADIPSFQNDSVPLQMSWKAHSEGIKAIQIIYEPSSILTTSQSSECILWNADGVLMDSLCQEDRKDSFNFPIQEMKRLKVEQSNVAITMNEITMKVNFMKKWKDEVMKHGVELESTPFITETR